MADYAEEVRLTLRLPPALRDSLTEHGKQNGRSLNAEIVARLDRTVKEDDSYGNIYDFTGELDRRLEVVERLLREVEEHVFPNRFSDWK